MQNIIDPHLHFFDLDHGDYQWLRAENPPFWSDKHKINQSFCEKDILLHSPLNLSGLVHIEAGFDNAQPDREIAFLSSSIQQPFTAIAYSDITLDHNCFVACINKLRTFSCVVGIRHILDEQAADILSHANVLQNLMYLAKQHLIFELQLALTDQRAVTALCRLIEHLPTLRMTLNHSGFPPETMPHSMFEKWQINLVKLAGFASIAIKCSGWEMQSRHYQKTWLLRVVNECVKAFGQHRVMMASNFPLCLLSTTYQAYWQLVVETLPQALINDLCYLNAKKWYNLV